MSSSDPIRELPFRVVLIETHFAGNLGSVARAMKNMGFHELVLVNPQVDPLAPEALRMAVHAADILHGARKVASLAEALGDCVAAVGTASKVDGVVRSSRRGFLREIMPQAVQSSQQGKVALVFGNEPNGMANDEVAACTHLVEIPTSDQYDSLNLATATGICLYELRVAWLDMLRTWVPKEKMATLSDQERCYTNLKGALEDIGFLYGEKSNSLFEGVRHMLMRCRPEMKDLKILHGLARQIRWYVRERGGVESEIDKNPDAEGYTPDQ